MKTILKKTSDIKPYINNPREISKAAIEKVTLSIKEFGFQQPIVVDKNNIIIAGHTRLLAAKQLKLKEVPIIVADQLTENQTKAYRLMDNRSAEDSNWDNKLLGLELSILNDENINLDLTGFEITEFLEFVKEYDLTPDDIEEIKDFNDSVNFIIKCKNIAEREKIQKILGIKGENINAYKFLEIINDKNSNN